MNDASEEPLDPKGMFQSIQKLSPEERAARDTRILASLEQEKAEAHKNHVRKIRQNWCAPKLQFEFLPPDDVVSQWWDWLEFFEARLGKGFLAALVGGRGCGKTQMGVELMRTTTEKLRSALYMRAVDLFINLKSSWRKEADKDEREILEEFCRPSLLIIDESQERGETNWENRMLTYIIDRRYADQKDTLLIANQPKRDFEAAFGDSVISRMVEKGGVITCDWPSFRKTSK